MALGISVRPSPPELPEEDEPRRTGQRVDIQGLRGVAVLLVVLSHAGVAGLAGGYVGVDVFFVLSGFLITGLLVRDAGSIEGLSIARFYGNRAKRLAPAASLCLLTTGVAGAVLLNYNRAHQLIGDIFAGALFYPNWHFALSATDYFAEGEAPSAVQHFWSLAVEEQFYVVWPLLIGLVFLRSTRDTADRREFMLLWVLAAITAASLAWSIVQTQSNPSFAYFSTFTRAWELGAGGLVALSVGQLAHLPQQVKAGVGWAGILAIAIAGVTYTPATPFPGYAAVLPVLGTTAVIAAGLDGPRFGVSALLEVLPLRWVGDISYSLYLWHWPILILGAVALGHEPTAGESAALVALAVAISAVSYYAVENKFRHVKVFVDAPRQALILWPFGIACVLVPLLFLDSSKLVAYNGARADAANEARQVQAEVEAEDPNATEVQAAVALAEKGSPLPAFSPSGDRLASDSEYMAEECLANYGQTSSDVCELGTPNGAKTVVLLGDSTAAMYVPGVSEAAKSLGWSFKPIVKYQCPAPDVLQLRIQDGKSVPFTECEPWRTWAATQIESLQPDIVILAGLTQLSMANPDGSEAQNPEELWLEGTSRTVASVKKFATSTVVLGMLPRAPDSNKPADCLADPESTMSECSFPIDEFSSNVRSLSATAAEDAGAVYADWSDMVCYKGFCPMVIGDTAVWMDSHHWTATFSRHAAPLIKRALRDLL